VLHRAAKTRLKLRLTSTWRALLERSDHVALIAEATFTPVVARTRFTLR
jgi:hypothetical protein